MNSFYAACDCGWTGKRWEYRVSAESDMHIHRDRAHRVPPATIFSTTEEPED